jgi:divalent metal cation (Fe/Co/Zn/Cd) transporter
MAKKKNAPESLPERQAILDALMNHPDAQAVLRLSVVSEPDGHWVIGATLEMIDSLPLFSLSHTLNDAKRRVREVVGETAEIYIEPELVRDPSREDPPTDVIVIKASD